MSSTSTKRSEIEKANEYLSQHHVKELFTKLIYELTYYRPNDASSFMIQRLVDFKQQKSANQQLTPMSFTPPKVKRVIFCIGPKGSDTASVARRMCQRVDQIHLDVEALMAREAAQGSDLAKAQAEKWQAGQDLPYQYILQLLEREMETLHEKDMQEKEQQRKARTQQRVNGNGASLFPQTPDQQMAQYETTFFVTGFPRTIRHVIDFERTLDVREVLYVDETLEECIAHAKSAGKALDSAVFRQQYEESVTSLLPVVQYFDGLAKLKRCKPSELEAQAAAAAAN